MTSPSESANPSSQSKPEHLDDLHQRDGPAPVGLGVARTARCGPLGQSRRAQRAPRRGASKSTSSTRVAASAPARRLVDTSSRSPDLFARVKVSLNRQLERLRSALQLLRSETLWARHRAHGTSRLARSATQAARSSARASTSASAARSVARSYRSRCSSVRVEGSNTALLKQPKRTPHTRQPRGLQESTRLGVPRILHARIDSPPVRQHLRHSPGTSHDPRREPPPSGEPSQTSCRRRYARAPTRRRSARVREMRHRFLQRAPSPRDRRLQAMHRTIPPSADSGTFSGPTLRVTREADRRASEASPVTSHYANDARGRATREADRGPTVTSAGGHARTCRT